MNSLGPPSVEICVPKWRAGLVVAVGFLALVGLPGCVQVQGGAIELSWSLRSFTGDPVDRCADSAIARIRVLWQADDGTSNPSFTDFACEDSAGVTGFEVPGGSTRVWVEPICTDGINASPGTFSAPAPIVRDVLVGAVVTLNSLLIVVSDNTKDATQQCLAAGCTCVR